MATGSGNAAFYAFAESIKLVIKPIVLKLCANTPAATKSITTPAKASAIPRYATMRLSKVCFALKLRKKIYRSSNDKTKHHHGNDV